MVAGQVFVDPQKHHPVAWFGSWATRVEKTTYADSRAAGAVPTALAAAPMLAGGTLVERISARYGWIRVAATAAAIWAVFGTRRLVDEGGIMADCLVGGDLNATRE